MENKGQFNISVQGQKKKLKKKRYSTWLITVNPNKRVSDETSPEFQQLSEKLVNIGRDIFLNNFYDYIKITDPDGSYNDILKDEVNVEAGVEIAPKTRCVHMHVLLKIPHRTKLQFDFEKMKNDMQQHFDTNIYYNYKIVKYNSSLDNYVNKSVSA